jgi:hypothetical protein
MLKKYFCLISFCFFTTAIFSQVDCPNFKIRGNKSPRSNRFTTAIKFQLDGIVVCLRRTVVSGKNSPF